VNLIASIGPTLAARGWRRVWAIDFEFNPRRGDLPDPVVCVCARCLITGEERRIWLLDTPTACPFEVADDELFVAHSATAEVGCFIAQGWPLPTRLIDTMVETARLWNGKMVSEPGSKDSIYTPGLLQSLAYFGIPARSVGEKKAMVELILDTIRLKRHFTPEIIEKALSYCMDDADDVGRLLAALIYASDLADPLRFRQAVWRGRGVAALTVPEAIGTPLDMPLVKRFDEHWEAIEKGLIQTLGAPYPGVFRKDGSFDLWAFAGYLAQRGIAWPRTPTGLPDTRDDTFKEQAEIHPELINLAQLMKLTKRTRLGVGDLAIGRDGRNRTSMRPFASKTGRNQPSGSAYLYAHSAWLRYFAQPPPDRALIILDWKAQELGVAAVLSGDEALWEAAVSDDPYVAFGTQIGQSPEEAKAGRGLLKATVLGVQYGMTAQGVAVRNKISVAKATRLLAEHKRIYSRFWAWSLGAAKYASEGFSLETKLGWRFGWPPGSRATVKDNTARNWPVQSSAAESMRLGLVLMVEARLQICAVIHDAYVIECGVADIEHTLACAMDCMNQASEMLLGAGRRIRISPAVVFPTDWRMNPKLVQKLEGAGITVYLGRYRDPRGAEMYAMAVKLLEEAEAKASVRVSVGECVRD
jgi:hypothetical protein